MHHMSPVRCHIAPGSTYVIDPPFPIDAGSVANGIIFRIPPTVQCSLGPRCGPVARPSSFVMLFKDAITFESVFSGAVNTFIIPASVCFCGPDAFPFTAYHKPDDTVSDDMIVPLENATESNTTTGNTLLPITDGTDTCSTAKRGRCGVRTLTRQ
jgi:hypothetical protein